MAAELAQSGLGLRAHIVGFGLTEGEIQQIACVAEQTGGQVLSTQSGAELADALVRTTTATSAPPVAPGLATIGLTIRADIAGRPDRVTFRAVSEQTGAAVEFGTLDFTQADVLPDNLAARQPLQVGDGLSFDEAALAPDPAATRCDDDTGCAMGQDAPQPGSGVVPVTITATGSENAPVDWFAQPIGRPDALSLGSGGPMMGPWTTALDLGAWALTGIAEDATFFAEIDVLDTVAQQFAITRNLPGDAVEMTGEDIAFLCDTGGICIFEEDAVGIISAIPEGWALDFPTREAATAGGARGFVRMKVFNTADPADTIVLNPHQWIAMNGPCIDVQAGALCHFAPASNAALAAIEVIRRSIRDTAPRNSPSPAEALAQVMGDLAKDDPAAAAAMDALLGAASGAAPSAR